MSDLSTKYLLYPYNLPEDIKEGVILYTTSMYRDINEYLESDRYPQNLFLDGIISSIDEAFKNAPKLDKDITLYRGLHMPEMPINHQRGRLILSGYKGLYKGFLSTSHDIDSSVMFTGKNGQLLKITIPKGETALFIEMISNIQAEQEVLLPRDSIIEVVSIEQTKDLIIVNSKMRKSKLEKKKSGLSRFISKVLGKP
jgi:hypothetical protein